MTPQTQGGPTSILFYFLFTLPARPVVLLLKSPNLPAPDRRCPRLPAAASPHRRPLVPPGTHVPRASGMGLPCPPSAAPPARVSPPLCHAEVRPCPASLSCRSGSAMPSIAGIGSGMVRSLGRLAGFDRNQSMVAEFRRILESPSSLR
jgi:hypothetical protein